MAKNTYYVVIENSTDTTSTNNSPVASNKKTQEDKNVDLLTNKVKRYASLNYAESVADSIITSRVNTVELRMGHRALQDRMEFAYGVAKQGFDIAKNMVMAGSAFGAGGVALGAVVGIVDWGIGIAIRQSEINMRQEVENTSLFFARIRAGAGQDRTGKTR